MANKVFVGTTDLSWATAGAWDPTGVPTTGDDVEIPATAKYRILNGLDQTAIKLGKVRFSGMAKTVGNTTAATPSYLRLKCSSLEFKASALAYVSVESTSSTPITIQGTAAAVTNSRGLFIKNSTASPVTIQAGSVGLAFRQNETATFTTVRTAGGGCIVGVGAALTTGRCDGGNMTVRTTGSTLECRGGTLITEGNGVHTVTAYGGTMLLNAAANVTVTLDGGSVDCTQEATTKTLTLKASNTGTLSFDPSVVTVKTTGGTGYSSTTRRPAKWTFA